jgi:hypothetical protein
MAMARMAGRWLIGGAVVIGIAPVARVPRVHSARSPGLSYTETSVVVLPTGAESSRTDTSVWAEQFNGDNWRTDTRRMPESTRPGSDSSRRRNGLQVGLYTLRTRGSSIVTVVDSVRRQYFAYDVDSALRSSVRMERVPHSGDTVFVIRVQPDTTIDGRHTEHWRRINTLTVRAPIGGEFTSETVSDIFIATGTKQMTFGSFKWLSESPLAGAAYSREVEESEAAMPQGLRVLIVSRAATGTASGSSLPSVGIVATQRLSDIQYGDVSDDVFAIPAGYQRVAPPPRPQFHVPKRAQ